MRILVITTALPYPPVGGGIIRKFHLVRGLAERHEVVLLCMGENNDASTLFSFMSECPNLIEIDFAPANKFYNKMCQLILKYQPEILQVGGIHLARYALQRPDVAMVFDEPDAGYIVYERLVQIGREDPKWLAEFQAFERLACIKACAVIVSGRPDLHALRSIAPEARYVLVESGVDTKFFRPVGIDSVNVTPTIVFTGTMSFPPNIDAVIYFCRFIFPLLLQYVPQARFNIVGVDPPPEVYRLQDDHPGVVVTGRVNDVRPYITEASVVVAPLRAGGGTRLKILEAMAMAKPIVTTSIGCEGLTVKEGRDLLVADTPEQFAQSIRKILTHSDLGVELGRNAAHLIQRRYSWQQVLTPLWKFYDYEAPKYVIMRN